MTVLSNKVEGAEVYDYGDGELAVQTPCRAGCERGLFYCPARFCGRCGGSGYAVRWFRWRDASDAPMKLDDENDPGGDSDR